jgi:phage host-nuclease inhibitor protein Gam
MSKPAKGKKKVELPVPANVEAAAEMQRRIAELADRIKAAEIAAEEKMREIEAELARSTDPLIDEAKRLAAQVHAFAASRRDAGKTVSIGSAGTVEWAFSPSSLKIEDDAVVVKWLERFNLERFIRRPPPEVNREALLESLDVAVGIPGVELRRPEKVYVRPAGNDVRVESTIGKRGPGAWNIIWPKKQK